MDIRYFTDGSYNNRSKYAISGFIRLIGTTLSDIHLDYNGQCLYKCYPDNNVAETIAIYLALYDIGTQNKGNKFYIYTDSLQSYTGMKQYYNYRTNVDSCPGWITTNTFPILYSWIIKTSEILLTLINAGFSIELMKIKAHITSTKEQIEYQKTHNVTISKKEAIMICKGNYFIDKLVNRCNTFTILDQLYYIG